VFVRQHLRMLPTTEDRAELAAITALVEDGKLTPVRRYGRPATLQRRWLIGATRSAARSRSFVPPAIWAAVVIRSGCWWRCRRLLVVRQQPSDWLSALEWVCVVEAVSASVRR